jgi:hypothetical protein
MPFQFFTTKDTFDLKVTDFVRNSAYCYTEAIPYAVLIGETQNVNLGKVPSTITVLASCDNKIYSIGQRLRVAPDEDPTANTTLRPLYITRDTTLNGQRVRHLVGAEHPAMWGKVL